MSQTQSQHPRHSNWLDSCAICKKDHGLKRCEKFQDMNSYKRCEVVFQHGYCRNCLARSHLIAECKSETLCYICSRRHHTMLHGAPQLTGAITQTAKLEPQFSWAAVFVPTATVRVALDNFDSWTNVRTLIRQSSPVSRIAASTVERLKAPSFQYKGYTFTTFKIMSRHLKNKWNLRLNALVADDLPKKMYSDPIKEDPTIDFPKDSTADIDPRCNTPIEMELGADVHSCLRRDGVIITGLGKIDAHNTELGYVFSGPARNPFTL